MQIKNIKAMVISFAAVVALMASPLSASYASDEAKKEMKPVSCKKQAKNKGIKDAAEVKKFVAECKKAAKAAPKAADKK
ncbi:MAG: hypothetical protein OEW97_07310 [Gammaproteobacteria bacterium]|nr:hypothetical protein [Gammaproteobacteria bacterium]